MAPKRRPPIPFCRSRFSQLVAPAQAGAHVRFQKMGSRLRGNDRKRTRRPRAGGGPCSVSKMGSPLRGNDQRWERFCLRGNDRKRGELRTRRPRAGGGPCSVSKNGFPPSRERPEVGAVPAF